MRKVMLAGAMLAATMATAAPAALVYDFGLNGSLANAAGGTGTLTNNGGTLGPTGISFAVNNGPTLSGIAPLTAYTIDLFFRIDATDGGYKKLVDFQDRGPDSGLYARATRLNFYPRAEGPDNAIRPGVNSRVTFSRDAAGNVLGYVDGVQQIAFLDTPGEATGFSVLHFFRDDAATGQGEASAGFVDTIRIFDQALTPAQALVSTVPEPASWALLIGGVGLVGGALRRRAAGRPAVAA